MHENHLATIETSTSLDTMHKNHIETTETSAISDTIARAIALRVLSISTQNGTMQQMFGRY
jgi:hypothetical protein